MSGTGVVRRIGWAKDEFGNDVFQAVIDFPQGPPPDMTFDVVWKQIGVTIAVAHESATTAESGKDAKGKVKG